MKVYGFFRGFPGLGRVMSGISILSMLKDMGHEVKAYSYLQGVQALKDHNIEILLDKQPPMYQVMAIGLNPICEVSGKIIEIICSDCPDLVIVDGEPLFISTLAMVYPKNKIISLLNPADLYNPSLPISTIKFYHTHYLAAGYAIVHGVDKTNIIIPNDIKGCDILMTNTILRRDVIDISRLDGKKIIAILGGGSSNASENFQNSTIEMGKKIIDAASLLPNEKFVIYCNDESIARRLIEYNELKNISIESEYSLPQKIYSSAKVIICRAGRNTISEILYLNLPAILMSASGDFRSSEQDKNIDQACMLNPGRLLKLSKDSDGRVLSDKIQQVINSKDNKFSFVPGNDEALDFIISKVTK